MAIICRERRWGAGGLERCWAAQRAAADDPSLAPHAAPSLDTVDGATLRVLSDYERG